MKKLTLFKRLFLVLAVISFAGCENEPIEGEFEASTPNNPNANSNFTAVIDGEPFTAGGSVAITIDNMGNIQTSVNGASTSGESISFSYTSNTTGTFELSDPFDGDGFAMYSDLTAQEMPFATTLPNSIGTLEVTQYDEENLLVSGTFSFQAEREMELEDGSVEIETVNITEGEFDNVPLNIQNGDSDGTPNEDFYINFTVADEDFSFEAYTIDSLKRLISGDNENPSDFKGISLWMPLDVVEGTYDIVDATGSDVEAYTAEYDSASGNLYLDATAGSITITTITSNYIEGTFNFSGEDESGNEIVITGGEFKAPIP